MYSRNRRSTQVLFSVEDVIKWEDLLSDANTAERLLSTYSREVMAAWLLGLNPPAGRDRIASLKERTVYILDPATAHYVALDCSSWPALFTHSDRDRCNEFVRRFWAGRCDDREMASAIRSGYAIVAAARDTAARRLSIVERLAGLPSLDRFGMEAGHARS